MEETCRCLGKKMNRLLRSIVLIAVAVAASGCFASSRASTFGVIAHNSGSEKLETVTIEFPAFLHTFGFLSPKIYSSDSLFQGRWPSEATVSWRIEGERVYMPDHVATVAMPPYPKHQRGEEIDLWFELDGQTVTAHAKVRRPISWRKQ